METVVLTLLNILHTMNIYFLNFKGFITQSLLRLFRKKVHPVEFHISVCNERRITELGFLKNAAAFFRGYSSDQQFTFVLQHANFCIEDHTFCKRKKFIRK